MNNSAIEKSLDDNGYVLFTRWEKSDFRNNTFLNTGINKMRIYNGQSGLKFFREVENDEYSYMVYLKGSFAATILNCKSRVNKNHTEIFLLVETKRGVYVSFDLTAASSLKDFFMAVNTSWLVLENGKVPDNSASIMGAGYL